MTRMEPSGAEYRFIEITLSGHYLASTTKRQAFAIFDACRIPFDALAVTDYKKDFRISFYTKSEPKAKRLQKTFRLQRPKRVRFMSRVLGRRDWFDKWKLDYHIRSLGRKFVIVPVWEKSKLKPSRRIPIFLEPGSAFGSGYHETTRLMIRLLESQKGITEFLDIGTGTGILSVAAAKLGASRVAAFDNDKPSVTAVRHNFEFNDCAGGKFFGANLKRLKLGERFSLVGANLISKVLLECRTKILATLKPGGILLVSGISKENLPGFRKGFKGRGLKCLKVLRGRKWCALAYRKA